MIVNDNDAKARLASPNNLLNRLRDNKSSRNSAMSLFGIGRKKEVPFVSSNDTGAIAGISEERKDTEVKISFNPFTSATPSKPQLVIPASESPILDNILENHEAQIKLGLAHDNALQLLNNSISALTAKLDDVKADKLPAVIAAASKTVDSIRRERNEASKNSKDKEVHYHFYTPQQNKITDYEVIDVT